MYLTKEICQIVHGKLSGNDSTKITWLLTDSRKISYPLQSLFFALPGERHDGHLFVRDVYQKGVRAFIVSRVGFNEKLFPDACFILVDDSLQALQLLAAKHRQQFKIPVIGITGSNGKTIVKEWLAQVAGSHYKLIRSPKSYNSQIGVPLSVWQMNPEHQLAIFEAGISLPGEMEKLAAIIRPNIGIFTHLSMAHQENFESLKQKTDEKLKLFSSCHTVLFPADDPVVKERVEVFRKKSTAKFLCWSKANNPEADLKITSKKRSAGKTEIEADFRGLGLNFFIPFTDEASLDNSLAVLLCMLAMGENPDWVCKQMALLTGVAMRLEMKQGVNRCTIINDSYNSDLASLQIALDFLNQQHQHPEKVLILSDIFQSGQSDLELYKAIAGLVEQKKINFLVGIGQNLSQNAALFTVPSRFFLSTEEFLKSYSAGMFSNQAILLKGARAFEFEKISNLLQKQAHRTVLEINLNAVEHNLHYFKSLLRRETKICVMVKAFSYGSGTFELANLFQFNRVDYLAVAFADEGAELRRNGISLPIIVMNPDPQGFDLMIENNLEPEIYSFTELNEFVKSVHRNQIQNYPVHLKVDTGMHRSGFLSHEIAKLAAFLNQNVDAIAVSTVFSHLAASDEKEHDAFTLQQVERFDAMYDELISHLDYKPMRHILNSAGIERFPNSQYEMVRLGIGVYGISARQDPNLQQIGTLKSTITQIKQVPASETVGYGRKGRLKTNATIATIPIGYADGLRRNLSQGVGKMLVRGHLAPIIGNICMDMTMLDVTNLDVKEGDEVVIFGPELPVLQLAEWAQTIPYEILTGISPRVKRVYFRE